MPDHWAPLAVLGRTRRYPLARVARLSGLAGLAHVLVSMVLGGVIVIVGLQLRSSVEHAENAIVGGILIATAAALIVFGQSGHAHAHDHDHEPREHRGHALAAAMVPFGASASPDLTILPVFAAATAAGAPTAAGALAAFAAVTSATIVALTLLATVSGRQLRGEWLERWSNAITAAVLVVIGSLILAGVL